VVIAVVLLSALLEPWRHGAVRITESISNIDVSSVAAPYGISAATIAWMPIVLPCRLLLRGEVTVWIAHPVTSADVPTMATWRGMYWDTILDLLN
jgi:hypothetical protein